MNKILEYILSYILTKILDYVWVVGMGIAAMCGYNYWVGGAGIIIWLLIFFNRKKIEDCIARISSHKLIPILEAVSILKKLGHKKPHDYFMKALFSNRYSAHDADTKEWIIFILDNCKQGKISLFGKKTFGKKKYLEEEKISSHEVILDRLGFDNNDIPIILRFDHQPLYADLKVNKHQIECLRG